MEFVGRVMGRFFHLMYSFRMKEGSKRVAVSDDGGDFHGCLHSRCDIRDRGRFEIVDLLAYRILQSARTA